MGQWHDRCEPDGELGERALQREFGAGAFPRLGPVRSTAFKCRRCGIRFPVPGVGAVARGQANAWWRKKHPLCARGEDPVHHSASTQRGARSPTPPHRPCGFQRPPRCICRRARHAPKSYFPGMILARVAAQRTTTDARTKSELEQERDARRTCTDSAARPMPPAAKAEPPGERCASITNLSNLSEPDARAPTRTRRRATAPRAATAALDRSHTRRRPVASRCRERRLY